MDYMHNPDFVTSCGETIIAQRMQQKEEIFARESEASEEEDKLTPLEYSIGNRRPRRAQIIKHKALEESRASSAPATSR